MEKTTQSRPPHRFSHLWPGVALALGSALLFGTMTPLSKGLLAAVDPQMLAGLLYLGAGTGLACVYGVRRLFGLQTREAPLRQADAGWLAGTIFFGGLLGPVLLMLGLKRTDAASASLLLNLEGLATMAIAWVVLREHVDRRLMTGAFAILAGALVLSWQGRGVSLDTGAILIASACLAWGIDNTLTRNLSASDPVQIALVKGLAAGGINLAIAAFRGAPVPDPGLVLTAMVAGFLGVGVSLVLFVLALRHLGSARTGAYFSLAPFIGAVLAIVFLSEPLTLKLVMAGVLMGIGLWLHLSERHAHTHDHQVLEHAHAHTHDEHHQHTHSGPVTEPHSHPHAHTPLRHAHTHYPDLHHRHGHDHDH